MRNNWFVRHGILAVIVVILLLGFFVLTLPTISWFIGFDMLETVGELLTLAVAGCMMAGFAVLLVFEAILNHHELSFKPLRLPTFAGISVIAVGMTMISMTVSRSHGLRWLPWVIIGGIAIVGGLLLLETVFRMAPSKNFEAKVRTS